MEALRRSNAIEWGKKYNSSMIESVKFIDLGRIYIWNKKVGKLPLCRSYRRP